jgi:hypothetical protein
MYRDDQVAMDLEHSETLREEAERAKQVKEERKKRSARFEKAAQDLLWDDYHDEPSVYGMVGIVCASLALIFIAIGLPTKACESLVERPQTMMTQASCLNVCGTQEKPVAAIAYQKENNSCICMRDGKPDTRAFLKGM